MELGINPKTVAKQRKRATIEDMKTGPREPRSTVPTAAEEAAIVAIRRHTLLPLEDCLYALQPDHPASDAIGAARSGKVSLACPKSSGTNRNAKSSSATPLAYFILILLKSKRRRERCIYLSASI
jgi:hypothetical protein